MNTFSRRAMLGAIAVAPAVVAAMPVAAAAPSTAWDRLMAECVAAEAEYRSADAFYNPRSTVDTDRVDALCTRFCELEDRLMSTPSPNPSALRWKLGKLLEIEEDRMTPSWSAKYVEQTLRDIARLLGGEVVA